MARREIDYSNPWRMMSMGVLKENAKKFFRDKTGIIIFNEGSCTMSIDDFELKIYVRKGHPEESAYKVSIHYNNNMWNITKLY